MSAQRRAIIVVDLAFGDCGKGTVVDFLTRRCGAHTIVRFNGGPQAGHNVVTNDGRHHTFSQFGSGTFVPGVRTLLSRFVLMEPYALFNEAAHLEQLAIVDAFDRLWIDARCPVITPAHQAANRLRDLARGGAAHGTCGVGVGETMQDRIDHPQCMIHAADLHDRAVVAKRLRAIRDLKVDQLREVIAGLRTHPKAKFSINTLLEPTWIEVAVDIYGELARRARILNEPDTNALVSAAGLAIFEGAQGVLLDERFGFHPHTTWSTTTFANAELLLNEAGCDGQRTRLGVLRTYFTRHGPGPLVTENDAMRLNLPEPHNDDSGWAGRFRMGEFDAVAARHALAVAGPVDALAVTHVDRLNRLPRRICTAYLDNPLIEPDQVGAGPDPFVREGGTISDIRFRPAARIEDMEAVTRRLGRCRAVYSPLTAMDADTFLEVIVGELRARVGVTSHGPTATDKRLVTNCLG